MSDLDPTVHAYILKLNHTTAREGQVVRLLSDYKSVSLEIDSLKKGDVIFANKSAQPVFVTTADMAAHLKSRPLILKCGTNGYFLGFKDRRRAERLYLTQ